MYNPFPYDDLPTRTEQDLANIERDRRIKRDVIDRHTDHLKQELTTLTRYIGSLLADGINPPLGELDLKRIADAKLALTGEVAGALLAINLAENQYRRKRAELEPAREAAE